MKFAWHNNITDLAAWNTAQVEEVQLDEYCDMLKADKVADKWDKEEQETDEFILLDD
jgi:hypothetical protein